MKCINEFKGLIMVGLINYGVIVYWNIVSDEYK